MKQLKVILLIFIFTHSKVGMALNFHYCGNHLAQISLAYNPKGCGMEVTPAKTSKEITFSQKKCCEDDLKVFQSSEDISIWDNLKTANLVFKLPVVFKENILNPSFPLKNIQLNEHPPPKKLAFYILNNAFIFYG